MYACVFDVVVVAAVVVQENLFILLLPTQLYKCGLMSTEGTVHPSVTSVQWVSCVNRKVNSNCPCVTQQVKMMVEL